MATPAKKKTKKVDANYTRRRNPKLDLYLPPADHLLLKAVCAASGETRNTIVRAALRIHLKKLCKELGVDPGSLPEEPD